MRTVTVVVLGVILTLALSNFYLMFFRRDLLEAFFRFSSPSSPASSYPPPPRSSSSPPSSATTLSLSSSSVLSASYPPPATAESTKLLLEEWELEEEMNDLAGWRKGLAIARAFLRTRTLPNTTNASTAMAAMGTRRGMSLFWSKVLDGAYGEAARKALLEVSNGRWDSTTEKMDAADLATPPEWRSDAPSWGAAEAAAGAALRAANQRRFAALAQRLRAGGEERELCGGPFPAVRLQAEALRRAENAKQRKKPKPPKVAPPPARLRWLHIPKSASTFVNTVLRYGCPSLLANVSNAGDVTLGGIIPLELQPVVLTPLQRKMKRRRPWTWTYVTLAALAQAQCGGADGEDDRARHLFKLLPGSTPPSSTSTSSSSSQLGMISSLLISRNASSAALSAALRSALADNAAAATAGATGAGAAAAADATRAMPFDAAALAGATRGDAARGAMPLGEVLQHWATHTPLSDPVGAAALFRDPAQRVLSAFHFNFGLHIMGFGDGFCPHRSGSDGSRSESGEGPAEQGGGCFQQWRAFVHRQKGTLTARGFAASPGVYGCAAKMLQGCGCATRPISPSPRPRPPSTAEAASEAFAAVWKKKATLPPAPSTSFSFSDDSASPSSSGDDSASSPSSFSSSSSSSSLPVKSRPRVACALGRSATLDTDFAARAAAKVEHMAFVGLTDLYDASVCLFHHFFPTPGPGDSPFFAPPSSSPSSSSSSSSSSYSYSSTSTSAASPPSPPLDAMPEPLSGPMASEFTAFNVGKKRGGGKPYSLFEGTASATLEAHNTTQLEDFVDIVDEIVFSAVLERFERDLDQALGAIREMRQSEAESQ